MAEALSVRVVTDPAELRGRAAAHAALRDATHTRNPFAGPEWTLTWLAAFTDARRTPFVLEAYRGDTLTGVVPLWHERRRTGRGVLRPVGRGNPWIGPFEIAGALALPGEGRDVGRAVVEHLCRVSDGWDWAHLALGDIAPWLEPEWLANDEFLLLSRNVVSTVTFDLDATPYRPRRNLREAVRRARNRLDRDPGPGGWQVTRAVEPGEVAAAFERLADLHARRSRRTDKNAIHADVIGTGPVREFLGTAVAEMARGGLVSVYELRVRDRVIAAQLVLHTARSTHFSVSGQDDAAWAYSAITFLQWTAVQDAQAAGHDLVDLSAGPVQAKLRWSEQVRSFHEFALVAPRRSARLAYWAQLPRSSAAKMIEAYRANRRST